MSESTHETRSKESRGDGTAPAWMTILPMISAAIMVGFWLMHAAGPEDTEALESPLILSVARQLIVGPGELYGPFGGTNPLVLIHAPLYYRLSAMAAWPWARSGVHPVTAARLAGRTLSILGLIVTLVAASRLARLGGGSRRAGWWAVSADRRVAGARRTALRGAAGHDGSRISNGRGPARALGARGWERPACSHRLGLRGIRTGGVRQATPGGGAGDRPGPADRGLAGRSGSSPNDCAEPW